MSYAKIIESARNGDKSITYSFTRKCDEENARNKGLLEYVGWYTIAERY